MKSSNRLLVGFGAVIAALVVLAIVLVLVIPHDGDTGLLPEDTPEGVLQRYLRAVESDDCETAYGYLSPAYLADKPNYDTLEEWCQLMLGRDQNRAWKAVLGRKIVQENSVAISVTLEYFSSGTPFDYSVNSRDYVFILELVDDEWKIIAPMIPFF